MEKLSQCQKSPVFMLGWMEKSIDFLARGAQMDVETVCNDIKTAILAEWPHSSGMSEVRWDNSKKVLQDTHMQLSVHGTFI